MQLIASVDISDYSSQDLQSVAYVL